jgi:hypothetical protein
MVFVRNKKAPKRSLQGRVDSRSRLLAVVEIVSVIKANDLGIVQ